MGLEDVGCFFQNGFPFWGTFVELASCHFRPEWLAHELSPPPPESLFIPKMPTTEAAKTSGFPQTTTIFNGWKWLFPTISHLEIWNHPIETTIKNQASDHVIKHLFVFKFHRFFVRKTPWSTKKKHCVFLIGFLHFFPMKISKTLTQLSQNAGLLGTLRLGCLGIHILTEHLWSIDFRQVTEVNTE